MNLQRFSPAAAALTLGLTGLAACSMAQAQSGGAKGKTMRVYIGTYTNGASKGIYSCRLDPATGALSLEGNGPMTPNPSFLVLHPNHRYLYAVNEVDNFAGTKDGSVTAFRVDPESGGLTQLNQQSSKGSGPCFITVDKAGKNVLVANYGSGSVASLPIHADGTLGPSTSAIQHVGNSVNKERQEGPHAHSINLDAANRYAFAADLGLDKLLIYRFDAQHGTLTPSTPPSVSVAPGSGPRHFAIHPSEKFAYVINEIKSTVTAFNFDPRKGTLSEMQTLTTLPEGFTGENSTADLHVSPNGRFLYGSNRGHNSIVIYRINQENGRLTYVGNESTQGRTPRNFGIDPSGRFLLAANQDSGTVVAFRIDPESGKLTPTGSVLEVPMPVCVKFVP